MSQWWSYKRRKRWLELLLFQKLSGEVLEPGVLLDLGHAEDSESVFRLALDQLGDEKGEGTLLMKSAASRDHPVGIC